MGNRFFWRALAFAALVVTGAAIIGIGAYNAGVAHGIATSGQAWVAANIATLPVTIQGIQPSRRPSR